MYIWVEPELQRIRCTLDERKGDAHCVARHKEVSCTAAYSVRGTISPVDQGSRPPAARSRTYSLCARNGLTSAASSRWRLLIGPLAREDEGARSGHEVGERLDQRLGSPKYTRTSAGRDKLPPAGRSRRERIRLRQHVVLQLDRSLRQSIEDGHAAILGLERRGLGKLFALRSTPKHPRHERAQVWAGEPGTHVELHEGFPAALHVMGRRARSSAPRSRVRQLLVEQSKSRRKGPDVPRRRL